MNDQFPDQPTMPMPIAKPPRKRRTRWLVIVILVGVVLMLGIGVGVLGKILGPSRSQVSSATATPTIGIAIATQTSQSANTATPTNTAIATGTATQATSTTPATQKPTPTPTPPLSSITHGKPRLGGLFSDFVGTYGTPTPQGDSNSQNFWTGPNQTIDINVLRNEQGGVTQLNILGPNSWNTPQTQSYCGQFLPDNAVQFNSADNITNYHSSAGDIVLNLQSSSVCLLSFAKL